MINTCVCVCVPLKIIGTIMYDHACGCKNVSPRSETFEECWSLERCFVCYGWVNLTILSLCYSLFNTKNLWDITFNNVSYARPSEKQLLNDSISSLVGQLVSYFLAVALLLNLLSSTITCGFILLKLCDVED